MKDRKIRAPRRSLQLAYDFQVYDWLVSGYSRLAPLYFRTLWRYRNCIIIIIISYNIPSICRTRPICTHDH